MMTAGVEARINRLESIVEQIGDAVLATTETIERLAQRIDGLSTQVEAQGKQVQQQGYQIFALCDAIQVLADTQQDSLEKLSHLSETLDNLVFLLQNGDE